MDTSQSFNRYASNSSLLKAQDQILSSIPVAENKMNETTDIMNDALLPQRVQEIAEFMHSSLRSLCKI
ncbi:hypothetical protein Lqua_2158 [Legionella quateirensis]|uniref:Uncharacterized protein n=1 Tax=Legionella quateirensis TaxID=45072 RepID=A0ABR5RR71_9GAMM|nr:hypothetical protein Lqua_2158 [Legionella quateirensis]